ncbi:TonB-dependent receptor plug domain-containing protein [Niveispirillum sp. SYP-B3756]|uniref:TonB-dependent receptor n=1 Tax=Niveispirillum sp. SYP-B3756 TaxID=2662178 RepID=UPI00129163B3|nr:TonB-dependent receptor [Niveispirillum sp. SYP-B3756]MQP68323.1 TonB-dependent receptor plug domain-containing protein [Niveispirillum sp. SYP-B3756]
MRSKLRGIFLCGVAIASMDFGVAAAQDQRTPTPTPAPAPEWQEIVVTARRRAEALQDVPVAVVAFTPEQIEDRQLRSEADLQRSIPGLTIRETEGSNQIAFSIRGQTIDAFSGSALAVVPYVNEVQANGNSASNYYDMESVQVLKGPQGTLFGRNATGGAVLFQTTRPSNDQEGSVSAAYGNYDYVDLKGVLNVPVIADKLLLRVAANYANRDGYQHNIFNGGNNLNPRLGKLDRKSGRVSMTFNPSENLTNTTVVEYTRSGGNSTSVVPWSVNMPGSTDAATGLPLASSAAFLFSPALDTVFGPGAWASFVAAHPGVNPGGYPAAIARQKQLGAYTVDLTDLQSGKTFFSGRNHFLTNATTYDVSDDISIKNIFGWSRSRSHYNVSELGSPFLAICTCNIVSKDFGNLETTRSISNETQVQGKAAGGDLEYILGAYYYDSSSLTHWPQTYFELAPVLPPTGTTSSFRTRSRSKALFVQTTYDLTSIGLEDVSITGGFRHTWERVRLSHLPDGNVYGNYPTNDLSVKFDKPSWTVGADYKVTDDAMLYITHRGSWRSGGLNGSAPLRPFDASGAGALFKPETAKDVEVGLKWSGAVADRPARFNVAAYKQWVKNVQRTEFPIVDLDGPGPAQANSVAVTVNVPEAQVKGFEVEASILLTDALEVGGNLAYTDAAYTRNRSIVFGNLFVYDSYADTPKTAGTAYVQLKLPLDGRLGDLSIRGDVYSQSGQYFSNHYNSLTPDTRVPAYTLLNMRVSWSDLLGTDMTLSAFATNLTNKDYYVGGLAQGASLGVNAAAPGRPRMYGMELQYRF